MSDVNRIRTKEVFFTKALAEKTVRGRIHQQRPSNRLSKYMNVSGRGQQDPPRPLSFETKGQSSTVYFKEEINTSVPKGLHQKTPTTAQGRGRHQHQRRSHKHGSPTKTTMTPTRQVVPCGATTKHTLPLQSTKPRASYPRHTHSPNTTSKVVPLFQQLLSRNYAS